MWLFEISQHLLSQGSRFFSRKSSFGGGTLPLRALSRFFYLIHDIECLLIGPVSVLALVCQTLDLTICLEMSFLSIDFPILATLDEEMYFLQVGKV